MRLSLILCIAALLAACALNRVLGASESPPPPPPPPAPETQTCPNGAVILATDRCPIPLPPPPPAPTANGHSVDVDHQSADWPSTTGTPPRVTRSSASDRGRRPASAAPQLEAPATDTSEGPGAGIQEGQGAFAKPPPMQVGSWYRVEFLVAPDMEGIAAEAEGRETTAPQNIFITPVMRVTLRPDANFEVVPQTATEQKIGLDQRASWHWNVSPKTKAGMFTLVARVEVLNDGEVVDDYTRRVDVRVTVGRRQAVEEEIGFLKTLGDELGGLFSSWQKALLALAALITAAFAVWKVVKNRGATP